MKTFAKKNWIWILGAVILLFIAVGISSSLFKSEPEIVQDLPPAVEIISLEDVVAGNINLSCQVEPVSEVDILSEYSGAVTKVSVAEGDSVVAGDILFEVENIQQRVAVADARVALESAQLALKDLEDQNNLRSSSSLLSQTQSQQDTLVKNALNQFYNNDLRVYPEENPELSDEGGPRIEGNYTCNIEGEYIIDVYGSASSSGGSFRYSGLESGTQTVSTTDFGTRLGDCGLELVFPLGFDKNETWILPIPNNRSISYQNAKTQYESTLAGRDIVINQTEISPELISQSRGRVNQARLRYQLALDNLNKTIVTSKISGVISGFDLDVGDYVTAFSSLGSIKTAEQLELVGYVNAEESKYINQDSLVWVGDENASLNSLAQTIDSQTRKVRFSITPPASLVLTEGLSLPCVIERSFESVGRDDGGVVVPLSSVSIIGIEAYVFSLTEEGIAQAHPVIPGAILGNEVVVYGDVAGSIIKDARGVRDGQSLSIAAQE